MFEINEELIAPSVKETIALFNQELSSVTFPDINQQVLESLVEQVMKNASALEEANALAQAAKETLESSQNELVQKCSRAIAYAKVYAEGNDELLDKLLNINFGKAPRPSKKVERNRSEESSEPKEKKNRSSKNTEVTVSDDLSEK